MSSESLFWIPKALWTTTALLANDIISKLPRRINLGNCFYISFSECKLLSAEGSFDSKVYQKEKNGSKLLLDSDLPFLLLQTNMVTCWNCFYRMNKWRKLRGKMNACSFTLQEWLPKQAHPPPSPLKSKGLEMCNYIEWCIKFSTQVL